MIINPYDTNIGKHVNTKKLEIVLTEFLIKGSDVKNLNYEYIIDTEIEVVFITGKNEEERELPIWNHPLLINDFRGRDKIFIDLRTFVRIPKDGEVKDLSMIVNNHLGFNFTIIKLVYMLLLNKDKTSLTNIHDTVAIGFTKWLTVTLKSSLTLDIESVVKLEIVTMFYILCLLTDEELTERTVENIYFKISKLIKVVRGNMKYVKDTCEGININPKDAVDLVENIVTAVDSPLIKDLNTGVLYNILGNTWNGVNPSENIIMSLEHIPTLIAVLSTSIESKSLKHSRLANILNDNKRILGSDNFVKYVDLTVKECIV